MTLSEFHNLEVLLYSWAVSERFWGLNFIPLDKMVFVICRRLAPTAILIHDMEIRLVGADLDGDGKGRW